MLRRHRLWREDGKSDFQALDKAQFVAAAAEELECIQRELFEEARERRAANMTQASSFAELEAFFAEDKRFIFFCAGGPKSKPAQSKQAK